MPAVAAWPLAVVSGLALLIGLALVFGGAAFDLQVYFGALVLPVALTPWVAGCKGMNRVRWSVVAAALGVLQMLTQLFALHPLSLVLHPVIVLLALVYLRPPATSSLDVRETAAKRTGVAERAGTAEGADAAEGSGAAQSERSSSADNVVSVEAAPAPAEGVRPARRKPSRRRRPRH